MSSETFLLIVVILLVVVSLPAWPYSKSWGYRPTGALTVLLVIFLVWAIGARRPLFRSSVGQDFNSAVHDVADSARRAVR